MPKRHYSLKIATRIQTLLEEELISLDHWASKVFLPSIAAQFAKKKNITDKQYQLLVGIEEKFNGAGRDEIIKKNEEKQEIKDTEHREWKKEYYETDLHVNAKMIAEHYHELGLELGVCYFQQAVKDILEEELPVKKNCLSMINSERAQRILDEWSREPTFPLNTLIMPRKSVMDDKHHPLYNVDLGFIMKTNVARPSAAIGGKKCLVLPKGNLKGFICEERELKLYRKKK